MEKSKMEGFFKTLEHGHLDSINDFLMDNTKNRQEERLFLNDIGRFVIENDNIQNDFFSEGGLEEKLLRLAGERPELAGDVYNMLSRTCSNIEEMSVAYSDRSKVKALLYARLAAFYSSGETKKDRMDRFNLLNKMMKRAFPLITKPKVSFEEEKVHEIDSFNSVLIYDKTRKLPFARDLWKEHMMDIASKGYYKAQNCMVLESEKLDEAHKWLDIMRNNKIIHLDNKSGLEGYDETVDFVLQKERKKRKSQSKLSEILKKGSERFFRPIDKRDGRGNF